MQEFTDHTELAGQLKCPKGTKGIGVANNMFDTNRGFRLYSQSELSRLLEQTGFKVKKSYTAKEHVKSNSGEHITREYCIVQAQKH